MKYLINEIFKSIQGEGLFIGTPMNFIRFTRCNLKCSWCDTDFQVGAPMDPSEIIASLDKKIPWVSLTGGEPMMEKGLMSLILDLKEKGCMILLETNGTLFDETVFGACDHIALDLKGPSSGNAGYSREALDYCFGNPGKTQIKLVFQDERDAEFFREIHDTKYKNWVIQPEWNALKRIDYTGIMEEFPCVRIIPQIHKLLEVR
ncbi:MAG: 7-carboxy-7-deazaguanine synthase QueE [Candidatus Altiarchaeota archaeon]|nr:7-carboxy-7-deazaguanine synthase QueE [Candidatus Altiarchaeota archaeon]